MNTEYLSLEGKVALVTGGSRGIGKAIALAFADAGADIIISSRKQEALDEVAKEIETMGRKGLPIAAHNRNPEDIRALMNPVMAPLVEIEERTFDVIMNTNLKGYFLLSQSAAQMMIERGQGGHIINISSVGGISPDAGLGVYCISKAAINMLTKALAVELGSYNIRVNALAPGVVKTFFSQALWSNEALMEQEMKHTPLKRIAEPEEVARMALTLVSDAAAYITGQILVMDGGGSV
jgi:dehydrogenase/reductase SDR family protein 4